ncbi:hypothetical protein [Streptomyces sedi]|uniref:Uncharacterized protein n=1 Tax=Streptomyces sedi TaxID=555059 RepID=A0A5C4VC21_9ACTN|nr:hypothetical protein [Streptomyces sedi]TNM33504.1 hypothetical protein FH715_03885 [Streptomyces sedi]
MTVRVARSVGIGVGLGLTLLLTMYLLVGLLWHVRTDGPAGVTREGRAEAVGSAEVLHTVETSNPTGADAYEITYLVLDHHAEDASRVLEEERARLEASRWSPYAPEHATDGTLLAFGASTERHDTAAEFRVLSRFLEEGDHAMPEDDFTEIAQRFEGRADLLIVRLRPRAP